MFDVTRALRELVQRRGSDLHLKVGAGPLYRVNGVLAVEEGAEPLGAEGFGHLSHVGGPVGNCMVGVRFG